MSNQLIDELLSKYDDDITAPERCGFVLDDGILVEVENKCHDPANGFDISGDDLLKYGETAAGSWHTHTGSDCNLTRDDFSSFLNYPHLRHYIVGSDGVACYAVDQGRVVREATHLPPRQPEEHPPRTD